ncbi:MAG: DUF1036 domain-containing protein [Fimbriimonadaceae bacterium]|nr:DUF1036 domain-containing protein [Alphaproteobacteria bacterium]
MSFSLKYFHDADRLVKNTSVIAIAAKLVMLGLLPFALPVIAATPAKADLRLCNQTDSQIGIAIGYKDKDGWATEGWWNLAPKGCETLLAGPLVSQYYFVYAVDYDLGGEWTGSTFMCTQDRTFTIQGTEDCATRGYEVTGFFEVDTGDESSWTVNLTEPSADGIGGR